MMKKRVLSIYLILSFMFLACSKDQEADPGPGPGPSKADPKDCGTVKHGASLEEEGFFVEKVPHGSCEDFKGKKVSWCYDGTMSPASGAIHKECDDPDRDGDGIPNEQDLCDGSADNVDTDHDREGDCEDTDDDGDGVDEKDTGGDNCKLVYNPGQEDADGDGIGNACDPITNTSNVIKRSSLEKTASRFAPLLPGDGTDKLLLIAFDPEMKSIQTVDSKGVVLTVVAPPLAANDTLISNSIESCGAGDFVYRVKRSSDSKDYLKFSKINSEIADVANLKMVKSGPAECKDRYFVLEIKGKTTLYKGATVVPFVDSKDPLANANFSDIVELMVDPGKSNEILVSTKDKYYQLKVNTKNKLTTVPINSPSRAPNLFDTQLLTQRGFDNLFFSSDSNKLPIMIKRQEEKDKDGNVVAPYSLQTLGLTKTKTRKFIEVEGVRQVGHRYSAGPGLLSVSLVGTGDTSALLLKLFDAEFNSVFEYRQPLLGSGTKILLNANVAVENIDYLSVAGVGPRIILQVKDSSAPTDPKISIIQVPINMSYFK